MIPRVKIKGSGDFYYSDEIEIMQNIAFIMKESSMGFYETLKLPYAVFLSLLKHFKLFILQQDPEYRQQLKKQKMLYQTEPDWDRLRPLAEKR